MLKLANKVAIVTGSSNGIGFAIAKRLLEDGARVVISSRNEKNVRRALDQLKQYTDEGLLTGITCHVSSSADRQNLFETTFKQFNRLDIVVSNVATNPSVGPVVDCPESVWDKIFEVNVKASFLLAKESIGYFNKSPNGGNIVFISSIAGYQPLFPLGAYSVSKTALLGLTKVLAQELAEDRIRVNCVAPGIIKTNFSALLHEDDVIKDEMLKEIPLKRIGTVDEIGGAVSFLVSDDASYITGETIVIGGGMKSRL